MNFKGSLRVLKEDIDVSALVKFCTELTQDHWNAWSFRQKTFRTHSNTKTFPLVFSSLEDIDDVPKKVNLDSYAWELVQPHLELLSSRYKGIVSRAILANLSPGGQISSHRDDWPVLQRVHRCHLPIITGPEVEFTLDGEVKYLTAGTLYEINNQLEHSVFNGMDKGRVHLIIDILPDNRETGDLIEFQDRRLSRLDNIAVTA